MKTLKEGVIKTLHHSNVFNLSIYGRMRLVNLHYSLDIL